MTAPFQTATLASVQPARIARIAVPEGAMVAQGELVVALEEGVQLARTEIAKAASESTLAVDLAQARWTRAKRDLDRLMRLHGEDNASSKELTDALADADITRIEYEMANFNQAQAHRAFERESRLLDEFRLQAPFSGYVSQHLKRAGETVDQLEGIVTLVQLDPLEVQVDCPLALAPMLAVGDRFVVTPADSRWPPRAGCVVLASRVADGGSQTFKVKLNVENADAGWIAGLKVVVDFACATALEQCHTPSTAPPFSNAPLHGATANPTTDEEKR